MSESEYRVVRQQKFKKGGSTPEFVDVSIPTEPVWLRFGPGRGTATRGVGSAWLMGSKTLKGSPNDFSFQMTKMRLVSGTPNVHFAIVHSREGTVDTPFLPAKGDDLSLGDLDSPILSFNPGTFKIYALGPGSSISQGKGSPIRYQGIGSGGLFGIGFSADLYPV